MSNSIHDEPSDAMIPRQEARALPRMSAAMTPGRALIAIVALSFLLLASFVWNHGKVPNGGWSGGSSDHYSHWSSAILFYHRGVAIYRQPLYKICPEVPAEGIYTLVAKGDVCNIPERAGERPLTTNWRQFPRPYPPGWLLWHAPAALLYEHTALSFYTINRLMVMRDLLAAHLAIAALAAILLLRRPGERRASGTVLAVRAFVVALAGQELVRWSLLGYYDAIAVAAAIVGIMRLRDRRDPDAALWFALAMFLHYRAIWICAPLLVLTLVRVDRGERAKLVAPLVLLLLTAGAFLLVRPALRTFPHTNPVFWFHFDRMNAEHWNLVVPLVIAFAFLLGTRAYLVAAVAVFQLYVVSRTLQVQPWHALSLIPLIALARVRPGKGGAGELAAAVLFLVESRQIFEVTPLPGAWLGAIFQARG
jgi:hypothetical protein